MSGLGIISEMRKSAGKVCDCAELRDEPGTQLLFKTLKTPLAIAIQRLSAVSSVTAVTSGVRKIRLRVLRTMRGFDSRISPIFALSTKWVSSCTVARLGRPDTYRAVMPQVRSAKVINSPPCTRPLRLWCLSCATSAYSYSPFTIRCHSGPTRLRNPVVSTMVQPEALSFSAAMSLMSGLSGHFGEACGEVFCDCQPFHQSLTCCSQAG